MNFNNLNSLRNKIDIIDYNIIKLLGIRIKLVKIIAKIKDKNKYPIYDKNRELQMLSKKYILAKNFGINNKFYIKKIFTIVCIESYRIESNFLIKYKKYKKKIIIILDFFNNVNSIFKKIFNNFNYKIYIIKKIPIPKYVFFILKYANLIVLNLTYKLNINITKFIIKKCKYNGIFVNINFYYNVNHYVYKFLGKKATFIMLQFLFNKNIKALTKKNAIYYIYPNRNKNNLWFFKKFKKLGLKLYKFHNLNHYNFFVFYTKIIKYYINIYYIKIFIKYCKKNNKNNILKYFLYINNNKIKNNLIMLKYNYKYYKDYLINNYNKYNLLKKFYNIFIYLKNKLI